MDQASLFIKPKEQIAPEHQAPRVPDIKSPRNVLVTALLLGWCVDWLFFDKALGISWPLFIFLWSGALWKLGRSEDIRPIRSNLWLLVPLCFFSIMVFVRANPFLKTFNMLASLGTLSYMTFFYAGGRVESLEMAGVFLLPFRVGVHSMIDGASIVVATADIKTIRGRERRRIFPIIRGALLALPLVFIFTRLLTSADLVFADWVQEVLNLELLSKLGEWFRRSLFILLSAWVIAGVFVYAMSRRNQDDERSPIEKGLDAFTRSIPLGFTETVTILTLVNALFLAFTTVQFTYLFGGTSNITEAGYTYAEYARRGFFELVTVAMLSVALILGLNWICRRESKRQLRWFNGLSSLMLLFVLVMLVSAFRRMRLYEAMFGYTELRLYVYVFMIWLGILVGWFLLTLWTRPDRFAVGFIVAAFGFLATLNIVNPDAFIVRRNLDRYLRMTDIDVAYLTRLSDDAVPQLIQVWKEVQGDGQLVTTPACDSYSRRGLFALVEERGEECLKTPAEILDQELRQRSHWMAQESVQRRWQSFHLSRRQALEALRDVGL